MDHDYTATICNICLIKNCTAKEGSQSFLHGAVLETLVRDVEDTTRIKRALLS